MGSTHFLLDITRQLFQARFRASIVIYGLNAGWDALKIEMILNMVNKSNGLIV
jgi:hypothetical protein